MNVSLTPKLEDLLKRKVETGMYNSVSEVVREALRLMEDRDNANASKLNTLRQEINKGIVSLDRGEGRPLDAEFIKERGRKILSDRNN